MATGTILDAFILFELLKRAFSGGGSSASSASAPSNAPAEAKVSTPTAQVFTSPAPASTPTAQVIPTTPAPTPAPTQTPMQAVTPGLPDFPGGWEADVPPPKEVVARAWSLLPTLWKTGVGTHVQEVTNGRTITYQAQMMAGNKKGVVAFRVKGSPKG